jgi:hypothetical protein
MPDFIKGLCIESGEGIARFSFSDSMPLAGKTYILEDITEGTSPQNKTFHEILRIFYTWMLENDFFMLEDYGITYDLRCTGWKDLKKKLKRAFGRGFERIVYVNDKFQMIEAADETEVPMYVMEDLRTNGNTKRVKGDLWSWSDYGLIHRRNLIGTTLLLMDRFGVDTKKYQDMRKCFDKKTLSYIAKMQVKFSGKVIER